MVKSALLLAACLALPALTLAADPPADRTYAFAAGQVLDVLYLNRRPGAEALRQSYFRTAGPIAADLGYQPLGALRVTGPPTQGNLQPDVIAFGGWPGDFADRDAIYQRLLAALPDLRQRRMAIWTKFSMTWYEVAADTRFTLAHDRHHALTAYWLDDAEQVSGLRGAFADAVAASGGAVQLVLTNGRSPFGYAWTPDLVVLATWDTAASAAAFAERSTAFNTRGVRHVLQLPVGPP